MLSYNSRSSFSSQMPDISSKLYICTQSFTLINLAKYDLILDKRWMHDNEYIVDYKYNLLHLLIKEPSLVEPGLDRAPKVLNYNITHIFAGMKPWEGRHV